MQNKLFLKASDICELLEVKQTSAYEIIGNLNKELEEQGYLTLPFPEVVNGFMVQYQLAKMVKLAAPPVIIRGNFHLLTPFPWGVSRMILSVVRGLCWPWSADRLLFHLIFCRK